MTEIHTPIQTPDYTTVHRLPDAKVALIKGYRLATKCGLLEAKQMVELFMEHHREYKGNNEYGYQSATLPHVLQFNAEWLARYQSHCTVLIQWQKTYDATVGKRVYDAIAEYVGRFHDEPEVMEAIEAAREYGLARRDFNGY